MSQFKTFAKDVIDSSEHQAESKFAVLHDLSTTITSYTLSAGMEWPLVSIPHFEIRMREARELSDAELIAFAPIVSKDDKGIWEAFAVKSQGWIQEGLDYQGLTDVSPGLISEQIHPFLNEGDITQEEEEEEEEEAAFVPLWQIGSAPTNASIVMMDLHTHPSFERMIHDVLEVKHTLLSEVLDLDFLLDSSMPDHGQQARSYVLTPVFETFDDDAAVVGFLIAVLLWRDYFTHELPYGTNGFVVDAKDTCGSEFTYTINGPEAHYDGRGGLQDPKFEYIRQSSAFAESIRYDGVMNSSKHCEYTLNVYPSVEYRKSFESYEPVLFAMVVVAVFSFTIIVFAVYDAMVQRRQHKVLATAQQTTAIVKSLFPKEVANRLLEEAEQNWSGKRGSTTGAKSQLKQFLDSGDDSDMVGGATKSKPIADFFPEVTIMFADIVGFTSWSSMREPCQVFTLLETIYEEFDEIARRRRVFKVETIGDCYVAVCGLPDPRKDNHVVMARFARDCLYKFAIVTRQLEVLLGPGTADLGLRVGLHSGPVTAGVLRGDRARFQLFGDTMNTTARVESTGMRNKIHISRETAELLAGSGKGHWTTAREEKVVAKGKGEMQTYFLDLRGESAKSTGSSAGSDSCTGPAIEEEFETLTIAVPRNGHDTNKTADGKHSEMRTISEKQQRLVDWNAEVMCRILREIVARRQASGFEAVSEAKLKALEDAKLRNHTLAIEEVEEVVALPGFDAEAAKNPVDPELIELGENVTAQLREYVAVISAMYQDNPFHNFEHASHVITSTAKLLSRITAPDIMIPTDDERDQMDKQLHDHAYGITSDPLTQFACIFAALVHDVDHPGVPNSQLIKEKASIAIVYKDKSVAEQNSVDLAWDLLMGEAFIDLRRCIYQTDSEFKRFRQLVVNAVMATDIMDKDLKTFRNSRWEKAFSGSQEEHSDEAANRKATIVIEHLIQASDVAHTMQHWHIYRKWNARLFEEMYRAYIEGRAEKDPSEFWYEGEIGFFDFYIIPLAKKLKDCGVFGVSSYEYLNYAEKNRREWQSRGQEMVADMVQALNKDKMVADMVQPLNKDNPELTSNVPANMLSNGTD
jgi:class 3 adenylate cyclase/ferritin-like metal-binding protein YciE